MKTLIKIWYMISIVGIVWDSVIWFMKWVCRADTCRCQFLFVLLLILLTNTSILEELYDKKGVN